MDNASSKMYDHLKDSNLDMGYSKSLRFGQNNFEVNLRCSILVIKD